MAGWVAFLVYGEGLHHYHPNDVIWHLGSLNILFMNAIGKISFLQFSPVVPMTLGAAVVTILASLITPAPSQKTIDKYFPTEKKSGAGDAPVALASVPA